MLIAAKKTMDPIGIFIILLSIAAVLAAIFLYPLFSRPSGQFGKWGAAEIGPCSTSTCTEEGKRRIVRTCYPDSSSGRGCWIDSNGKPVDDPSLGKKQLLGKLVVEEPCRVACRRSIWREEERGICIAGNSAVQCVQPGQQGERTVSFRCVPHDPTGINGCTSLRPDSSGTLTEYKIGDVVSLTLPCSDYTNPTCGSWRLVSPIIQGAAPVEGREVSECTPNSSYVLSDECYVEGAPGNDFQILREGVRLRPLSCISDGTSYMPSPPGLCAPIECTEQFNPSTVQENPIVCPTSSSSTYQCASLCRYFPHNPYFGDERIRALSNLMIWVSGGSFVAPRNLPSTLPLPSPLSSSPAEPGSPFPDIPLMLIPTNDFWKLAPGCSREQVVFNSAAVFLAAPRQIVGEAQVLVQIAVLIGTSYWGWLATDPQGNLMWKQAQARYGGPGITSSDAPLFLITTGLLGRTKLPGFPTSMIGTIPFRLYLADGRPVSLLTWFSDSRSLGETELGDSRALLFETTTNLCTREFYGETSCNLYQRSSHNLPPPICTPPPLTPSP